VNIRTSPAHLQDRRAVESDAVTLAPLWASQPSEEWVSDFRCCEGFRMTAHRDGSARPGAVVRKPPVKERAGGEVPMVIPGYGDLIAVLAGEARRESMAVS